MTETELVDIPDFLRAGARTNIGSHRFVDAEIIRFAKRFDPQEFHVDPEKAHDSLFGGLCASGWHTVSVWMKLQRRSVAENTARLKAEGKSWPEFGPSPGMKRLKWLRPVYAGETITYFNEISGIRESRSRPGWWLMTNEAVAENQDGKPVMTFESTVFLKIHDDQSL